MKKLIFILILLIPLTACTIKNNYAGKNISLEGYNFKFSCGKTPSGQEISFNPPITDMVKVSSLLDSKNTPTFSMKDFLNLVKEAKEECNDFLKGK